MPEIDPDTAVQQQIDAAVVKSTDWLRLLQCDSHVPGVSKLSPSHDTNLWPGVLLPATYNSVMCLDLIGSLDHFSDADKQHLASWINGFRQNNGAFRVPGMTDANVRKRPDLQETWRYIDFHIANYCLGAIETLTPDNVPNLNFAEAYLDPKNLGDWLNTRDFGDPWQEGNNFVNLASFLVLFQKWGAPDQSAAATRSIQTLFEWQEIRQVPQTGFWGIRSGDQELLFAMAGAMHNYHIWRHFDRELPYQIPAVDYVLSRPTSIHSACIDVDEIDLLVHACDDLDHRRADIEIWLRCKLKSLLEFQNADGGFADTRNGTLHLDGWVNGYAEPQGQSNTFATWFRWIAIAMIDDFLWQGRRPWRFRKMIGIGYRKPHQK